MKQIKQNYISIILIVGTAILAIISYFLLPDTVITQFGSKNSAPTTMSKLYAIAMPSFLGIGGGIASVFAGEDINSRRKPYIISAVGIIVFIMMLIVNLI